MTPRTRRSGAVAFDTTPVVATVSLSSHTPPTFSTPTSVTSSESRPLCAAKLIAGAHTRLKRKGVIFSPQNQTQIFNREDPPVPSSETTPPSIRSYAAAPSSDPPSSSASGSSSTSRSAYKARPILKSTDPEAIRVARTSREGSWANRERARLLVTGNKPRAAAPASSSLAMLCDSAEDGVEAHVPPSDSEPGSDDSNASGEMDAVPPYGGCDESESEQEEEVECLRPASLVSVILDGAADLLTLEEAYTTLTLRVRETLYDLGPPTERVQRDFMNVLQPIADEAPAIVRAMSRDLNRLMGKVPQAEASSIASSPFRSLRPDSRKTGLLSPSSTPTKGYTASEILYRREAASVGSVVLRFLAAIFSSARLYSCFSDADIQSLLDQVLVIPKTPVLPTPQPRRTYALSMVIFSNIRLPEPLIELVKDKVVGAVDSALNTLGTGPYNIRDPGPLRREAYLAIDHLVDQYPRLFFPAYPQFLSSALRGMGGPAALRRSATAAASTFVTVKLRLIQTTDLAIEAGDIDAEEWGKVRNLVRKSEQYVVNFLKSPAKVQAKDYDGRGPKLTEWNKLESVFRLTVGSAEEVGWACTTWAVVVSLMGQAYNTSTHLKGINHIMDRSLQQSANAVRPVLACAAWQHAIYAYLTSGSNATISDAGKVIHTHTPFTGSSYQDAAGRTSNILFPITLALDKAHDPESVTRSLVADPAFKGEKRWAWQRSEKIRRFGWMITTGSIAPAILYAYTTLALEHVDSAVKDISRISGLPSSDGPAPDLSPEEERIPRLDQTFENVVRPMLQRSFSVCGVDKLKVQAWEMLEAITEPPMPDDPRPRLDRLLSVRFLDGDLLSVETVGPEIAASFEGERIRPVEIPAWGKLWVAKRLGKLLALFQDALNGVYGLDSLTATKWVANQDGLVLLPAILSRVWTNLLSALAITNSESGPTPLFVVGLRAVARLLIRVFDADPAKYIPIRLLNAEGKTTLNPDAIRIGITLHLYQAAVKVLGEKTLGSTQINMDVGQSQGAIEAAEFKHEPFGYPTIVGYLLGHILRTDVLNTNDKQVRERFCQLVGSLLNAGSVLGTRTLGEVTNMMPWLFEGHQSAQMDVWRLLALKWTDMVDLQPSDTSSQTNHTGALLVSLLSAPFRNRDEDSLWFPTPAEEDFNAWTGLLKATVLRFRAKRVGSNFGVLETLSAHMDDFLRVDDAEQTQKRKGCATTLRCLAASTSWISFSQPEHYHASHYNINENYVPVDFLTLVGEALLAAHPKSDGGVTDVVRSLIRLLSDLTPDVAVDVLEPVRKATAQWMEDKDSIASDDLGTALDELYIATLGALTRAIEGDALSATSETVNTYIDVYAPRLSYAKSQAVLTAFQDFWGRCFAGRQLEFSEDTAGFLRDVLSALPGFIAVEGLDMSESSVGSESARALPFAESVQSQIAPANSPAQQEVPAQATRVSPAPPATQAAPASASQATPAPPAAQAAPASASPAAPATQAAPAPSAPAPIPSAEYDADVSESTQPPRRGTKRKQAELVPVSSPADVFGPATKTKLRATRSRSSHRSLSSREASPNPANDTVIADTDIESPVQFTPGHSDDAEAQPSLFKHASKWLRRVPSFGLFSPTKDAAELPDEEEEAGSPSVGTQPGGRAFSRSSSVSSQVDASSDAGSATSSLAQTKSSRRRRSKRVDSDAKLARAEESAVQEEVTEPAQPAATEDVPAAHEAESTSQPRRSRRRTAQLEVSLPASTPAPAPASAIAAEAATTSAAEAAETPAPAPATEPTAEDPTTLPPPATTRSAARRKREVVEDTTTPPTKTKKRRMRQTPSKADQLQAEDELLLSDASAERHRREEDMAIAREQEGSPLARVGAVQDEPELAGPEVVEEAQASQRPERRKAAAKRVEVRRSSRRRVEESVSQEEEAQVDPQAAAAEVEAVPRADAEAVDVSGIFDDAPGDETPARKTTAAKEQPSTPEPAPAQADDLDHDPLDLLPSPARRTAKQTHVLRMVSEAAREEEAIEHLDVAGIKELIANLDRMKNAATATLLARAEEARARSRSSRSRSGV